MMQFLAESANMTVYWEEIIGIIMGNCRGFGICSVISSSQGMTLTRESRVSTNFDCYGLFLCSGNFLREFIRQRKSFFKYY